MNTYTDLQGTVFGVAGTWTPWRSASNSVDRLKSEAAAKSPEWTEFRNYWMAEVERFYSAKGLSRRQILDTIGYRIGRDLKKVGLESRQGQMRASATTGASSKC